MSGIRQLNSLEKQKHIVHRFQVLFVQKRSRKTNHLTGPSPIDGFITRYVDQRSAHILDPDALTGQLDTAIKAFLFFLEQKQKK